MIGPRFDDPALSGKVVWVAEMSSVGEWAETEVLPDGRFDFGWRELPPTGPSSLEVWVRDEE